MLLHVLHSLCFHQWRESLSMIFQSWTPEISQEEIIRAAAAASAIPGLKLDNLSNYSYADSPYLQKYLNVSLATSYLGPW